MRGISVPRVEPEVERQEGESIAFVLPHVRELVTPQHLRRCDREDDHVTEGDRDVAPVGEHAPREAAIAHIQKATIASDGTCAGEKAEDVADGVGVVREETQGYWMLATICSTDAMTCSFAVSAVS